MKELDRKEKEKENGKQVKNYKIKEKTRKSTSEKRKETTRQGTRERERELEVGARQEEVGVSPEVRYKVYTHWPGGG